MIVDSQYHHLSDVGSSSVLEMMNENLKKKRLVLRACKWQNGQRHTS